jgi:site-specific DNA recombinase
MVMTRVAAIWARVSSPGQAEMSPDSQVERVKTKLNALGYAVPPEYIFKVVWTSVDLEPCPEFQEFRRLIRTRQVNAVGFLDRDRINAFGLARLMFFSECKENGVEPIVYQGAAFTDGTEGQIVELALALGKERSVQRAQTGAKQGLEDRAKKKGLPPTIARVYGMTWPKGVDGKYLPNEDYDNAKLIFELWFERCNLDYIGKELLRRGIPSPKGNMTWASCSLTTIIKNPVYAGRVATLKYEMSEPKNRRRNTFGKTSANLKPESEWHYLDGLVAEPLINWQQHLEIVEWLKNNKENASRNAKHNYLLRGLISCQLCHGNRHYFGIQPSTGRAKYVCNKSWATGYREKCLALPMDKEGLEDGVKDKVRAFFAKPEVYLTNMQGRLGMQEQTKVDIEQRIKNLEREYQATIDTECRYADMLSPEAFDEKKKLLMIKRQYLNGEKEQQTVKLATLEKATINRLTIEALKKRLQRNLDTASEADWRFILDILNANVLAFGDGSWDLAIDVPPMSENVDSTAAPPMNSDNDSIVNNIGCYSSLA